MIVKSIGLEPLQNQVGRRNSGDNLSRISVCKVTSKARGRGGEHPAAEKTYTKSACLMLH